MDQGLIPQRYARALYKVAMERQCAEPLYAMMKTLSCSFAANPSLDKVMGNPFVAADEKKSLLLTAAGIDEPSSLKGIEKEAATTLADFIKLLCQNQRIEYVRGATLAYIDIYRRERDIHTVTITSAAPLEQKAVDRLMNIIKSHRPGGTFEMSTAVDPDLIGGFTIAIDNERLDASVSNELRKLRFELVPNK